MRAGLLPTLGSVCGVLLLVGCGGVPTVNTLPTTVSVRLGEEFRIADPELVVRFAEVIQDSRCPVDVACLQAGSATLRFSVIEPNGDLGTVILETGGPGQASHGLAFRLVGLTPDPRSTRPINPKDYRATVEVGPGG
jgi:hypothetical protein